MESTTTSPKFNVQIDVPHKHYGQCQYFMPNEMAVWWAKLGFSYSYVGSGVWGTGVDDQGRSTHESNYMVYGIDEADALAFKIQFPHVRTHVHEQFDYVKAHAEHLAKEAKRAEQLKRRRDRYAAKKVANSGRARNSY